MMKFFHASLSVQSIKQSRSFYEKVFEMKFKTEGKRPELGIKFIMLEDKNGTVVELVQHEKPKVLKEDLMDFSQTGIKHIAFIVDNLEETMEKAKKEGAKIIWDITKGITVKRLAFISDPNNIPVEIIEI